MDMASAVAKNLTIIRKQQELTIDRVSKLADLPVSTISNILGGKVSDVRASTLVALAKALNCSVDDLLKTD